MNIMKTTLTAASLCLALSIPAHAEGDEFNKCRSDIDPSKPVQHKGELQDGKRWVFGMATEYTVYDQISIYGTLKQEGGQAHGRQFVRSGDLEVVLVGGDNNETREKSFPLSWAGKSRAKNPALGSFHLTMEKMFGKLRPGKYAITFETKQIRSKTVQFEIIPATLEEAMQKAQIEGDLKLELRTTKQGQRVARLKNTLNHQLIFSAYVNAGKQAPPAPGTVISGIVGTQVWNPRRGWKQNGGGWCGTGLGQYILKPGQTVDISVHPFTTGIIRHHLHASTMADGKRKAVSIYSDPFLAEPKVQ
jgi:hypothetical protein